MSVLVRSALLFACVTGLARTASAQVVDSVQALWIEVRDAASKSPVGGARVRALRDSTLRAVTDSTGMAALTLPIVARQVVTTRLGFRPDTTAIDDGSWAAGLVSVQLVPNAQPLAPVAVEGESPAMNPMMREFEDRRARRAGGANFIGPEEFQRRPSSRLTDFFLGRAGVKLVDSSGVKLVVSSRGEMVRFNQNRRIGPGRNEVERVFCVLRVALNGMAMEWGFDLNVIDPKDVYGVEIYSGPATMPPQYQSMGRDGYCGLILVWTRAK